MKKGWKIFWITCSIVAGLGIILCVAGFAMGGSIRSAYQEAGGHYYRRGVTSQNTDDDYDDGYDDEYDESHDNGHHGRGDNDFEETYEGIDRLDLDLAAAEIYILPGKEGEVRVTIENFEGRHCGIDVHREGSELTLESRGEGAWCMKDHVKDHRVVTIHVPSKLSELDLSLQAGYLEVGDVKAENLSVDVAAGDVYFTNMIANTAEVDCSAGKVEIYGDVNESLEIDCSAGEVVFHSRSEKQSYDYGMDCATGSIKFDGEDQRGESKISNQAGRYMEIDCEVGKVEVDFNN